MAISTNSVAATLALKKDINTENTIYYDKKGCSNN